MFLLLCPRWPGRVRMGKDNLAREQRRWGTTHKQPVGQIEAAADFREAEA
jgi:hypothetical protein